MSAVHFRRILGGAFVSLMVLGAPQAIAQYEVAEIPFFNTPKGTAALGGGLRLGQDLYLAFDDSTDQRQFDLVPLYLYNGKYVFLSRDRRWCASVSVTTSSN